MQVKWAKLAVKVTIWLTVEVLLGLVGLDNLADYGEFVAGDSPLMQQRSAPVALIMPTPYA